MFGLFKKNLYLGVDIGTSAIKVVELKLDSGVPTLTNYAWMGTESLKDGDVYNTVLAKCLARVVKSSGFKSRKVNISVPSFGGLITLLEFPSSIRNDLAQAIKFEAYKYVPTTMEEVVLSWDILSEQNSNRVTVNSSEKNGSNGTENGAPSGKIQVMLVAASKDKVFGCETMVKNAGLTLQGIEIESFSMVRSLIGNDQGNFVILDIGSRICNIILVEKGIIRINRNIDAGGKDITRTIAQNMGISEERAEGVKMSNRDFFSKESSMVFPTLESIAGEVSRAINAYYKTDGKSKVDAIILSGGTANLNGLDKYFSEKVGIKAIIGNPFSRLNYDKKLEPVVRKIGTQFSVAIGLALKDGIEKK